MTVHRRIRSGERPYQCAICKNKFYNIPSLIVHKRINSQDKQYKCATYNKTFSNNSNLSGHKIILNFSFVRESVLKILIWLCVLESILKISRISVLHGIKSFLTVLN